MFSSRALLFLSLCTPLFAQEMAIERLQSVVDEVSELRMRYEASAQKNKECEAQIDAIKKGYVEKNRNSESLVQEKEDSEQYRQGVQERTKKLHAENKYLRHKTEENEQAKRDAETALSALRKENKRLRGELAKAKKSLLLLEKSESVCPEENPFPKLLMREEK